MNGPLLVKPCRHLLAYRCSQKEYFSCLVKLILLYFIIIYATLYILVVLNITSTL